MKYLVKYDAGYGDDYEVIEADSLESAEETAYEAWKEAVECNASYSAQEFTEQLAEEYCLDWEE